MVAMITQKKLKSKINYCPETGVFTWIYGTGLVKSGDKAGRVLTTKFRKKYSQIKIFKKHYLAHRLAYFYMVGEWPIDQVDHIDGNGLNNKWVNLRAVSASDNCKNKRLQSNNKSGVAGVSFNSQLNKWKSVIYNNKTQIHLGYFSDKFEAICVRKSAERSHGFHINHGQDRPL